MPTESSMSIPLPLTELKRWVLDDVYSWLEEGDEKQEKLKKELEENSAFNVSNLFGEEDSDDDNGDDGNDGNDGNDGKGKGKGRIQTWSSSSKYVDGIGGFHKPLKGPSGTDTDVDEHCIRIIFILSESYQGFGDVLWSSARHIANVLANSIQCQEILAPMLSRKGKESNLDDGNYHHDSPLHGVSFLELGAGAGLPSWTAMHCGARVVCTDISDTNRIRSMGECVERNFRLMEESATARGNNDDNMDQLLDNAKKTKVCPHDWGSPCDKVTFSLNKNGEERFDVIIAADCCYMPWLHDKLLDSIHMLISDIGIALVPFALHGNTDDEDVWKIVDRAKAKGFEVDILKSQQLTPPSSGMDAKQGLVHTVQLMKKLH